MFAVIKGKNGVCGGHPRREEKKKRENIDFLELQVITSSSNKAELHEWKWRLIRGKEEERARCQDLPCKDHDKSFVMSCCIFQSCDKAIHNHS